MKQKHDFEKKNPVPSACIWNYGTGFCDFEPKSICRSIEKCVFIIYGKIIQIYIQKLGFFTL
jgi:hypothetical protein